LLDGNQRRINVYSASGAVLDHWAFDAMSHPLVPSVQALMTDSAGFVYRLARVDTRNVLMNGPTHYLRWKPGNPSIDTITAPDFPTAPTYDRDLFRVGTPANSFGSALAFWPNPVWAWSPLGYMVTGVPTRYAIELRVPVSRGATASAPPASRSVSSRWRPGDPVVSIRRNVSPVPIADAERAERRARTEFFLRGQDPGWKWRGPDIPKVKPAYTMLRIGLDGRLWVAVAAPSERRTPRPGGDISGCPKCDSHFQEAPLFDVFEPDGRYRGQVRLAGEMENQNFLVMRGDSIWGVARGSDDVQSVKRWRVTWR
jgi:hypothetical protein